MALSVAGKIINDWVEPHDTSLSSGLVALITISNFNVSYWMILLLNAIHYLVYSIRYLLLLCHYLKQVLRHLVLILVEEPFEFSSDRGLLNFYTIFSVILIVGALMVISVLLGYKVN